MARDDEVTTALGSVNLFSGLDAKTLKQIAEQTRRFTFTSGASVIDADAAGRFGRLYIVMSGTAEATVGGQAVAAFGPGDFFGEMSVLDGSPRSATVVATSDLDTVALTSWNMRALLRTEPNIALHVIETLTKRIRALDSTPLE